MPTPTPTSPPQPPAAPDSGDEGPERALLRHYVMELDALITSVLSVLAIVVTLRVSSRQISQALRQTVDHADLAEVGVRAILIDG